MLIEAYLAESERVSTMAERAQMAMDAADGHERNADVQKIMATRALRIAVLLPSTQQPPIDEHLELLSRFAALGN